MAITYPTTLDSFTDLTCATATSPKDVVNDLQDAVEALESKVGISGSAVTTSHDYKLSQTAGDTPVAGKAWTPDSTIDLDLTSGSSGNLTVNDIIANDITAAGDVSAADVSSTGVLTLAAMSGTWNGWISAGETWTYSSVDDPTGIFTVSGDVTSKYSKGMRIKFVNNGNTVYGKISADPSYSAPNTTIKFLHQIDPSDNQAVALLDNSAITSNFYSFMASPQGFPTSKLSWSLKVATTATSQATPTQNTWYNKGGSLVVPIGDWLLEYDMPTYVDDTSSTYSGDCVATLSTANNSESHSELSGVGCKILGTAATSSTAGSVHRSAYVTLTSKTTYYGNIRTTISGVNQITAGFGGTTIIRATFDD